jgi:hypothetical protein
MKRTSSLELILLDDSTQTKVSNEQLRVFSLGGKDEVLRLEITTVPKIEREPSQHTLSVDDEVDARKKEMGRNIPMDDTLVVQVLDGRGDDEDEMGSVSVGRRDGCFSFLTAQI